MKSLGLSLLSVEKIHNRSHLKHGFTPSTPLKGFTIVELLVVIVIIGILAAITIVSYTGITQKAVLASLQSDLSNSSRKLKMYQVEHDTYPASLDSNSCPKDSTGTVDTRYCLKPSSGNTLAYGSSSPYSTFSLTATNVSGTSYQVTDNSQPTALAAAPLSPVADWLATTQGDHYGNYYNLVSHNWATVTRTGPKTIYDPNANHIYDVPANYLAMNPWSSYQTNGRGSAAVIEEQRTNYLVNSYFAADTNADGLSDGLQNSVGVTFSRQASPVYGTEQRYAITGGNISSNFGDSESFVGGDSATLSVYIRGTSSLNPHLELAVYDATWAPLGTATGEVVPTAIAARHVLTYSNLPVGTAHVTPYITAPSGTYDLGLSAVQLEKGTFPTSYIPTTTAAVTRNADVVTVPTTGWNAAAGAWVAVAARTSGDVQGQELLYWGSSTNNLELGVWNNALLAISTDSTNGNNSPSYGNAIPTTPGVAAMSWTTTAMTPYWNGSAFANNAGRNPTITQTTASLGWAYIGADNRWSAPIQRLMIYSSALSSSDVTTVTNAVKNGP